MSNDKTEVLPAVAPIPTRRSILRRPAPARTKVRRHLRAALAGIALAAALLAGLQAYAAHGIADARQAAADHARSQVSVPR